MKLSNETKEVLDNFAGINANLVIGDEGFVRSVTTAKNLLAKATITDNFPYKFGIYDLNSFLGSMAMFDDPDLEFDDKQKFVKIKDKGRVLIYRFADIGNLVTSDKDVNMPDVDVSFTLSHTDLMTIKKASATLQASHFVVKKHEHVDTDGNVSDVLLGVVTDTKNASSNEFAIELNNSSINTSETFEFVFDINNFKFIVSDDYNFEVSSKLISSIKTPTVTYWSALLKTSKYGE